jgi:glycosyltransferase involved in cell wall biosynthesis
MNCTQTVDNINISSGNKAARLERPVRLIDQTWPVGTPPLVSVFCITYQHDKFIRQAIEGFLMQETTFPVEIFIHDDASTDGTAEIIKEYAERFPRLFWTVFQTENQWSKGNKKILFDFLEQQRGEFIAVCEGDDYWTSPQKLENQAIWMRAYPDCSFCFHQTSIIDGRTGLPTDTMPHEDFRRPNQSRLRLFEDAFAHTSAFFGRRSMLSIRSQPLATGDVPLMFDIAAKGFIGYIDLPMSSYRRHPGGVWQGSSNLNRARGSTSVMMKLSEDLTAGEHRQVSKFLWRHLDSFALSVCATGSRDDMSLALSFLIQFAKRPCDLFTRVKLIFAFASLLPRFAFRFLSRRSTPEL